MKTIKHTLSFNYGVKVTVERPYTMQDVMDEFKADVEKLGGKVTQVQDELRVSGLSATASGTVMHKLSENLKSLEGITDVVVRARAVSDDGPFKWPSFSHITREQVVNEKVKVKEKLAKAKKVADVAPQAMSTWEFSQEYLQRVYGTKVHVVGQHFRPKRAQNVIGYKKVGNMALLVAEPDNPVDLNTIMVLMWEDETKSWQHVGYVRATEAALLRSKWKGDHKHPMVARITSYPSNADGHRGGRNIELTLTGEVRTYPGYVL